MSEFAKLNKTLGPSFNRAAPDAIRWASEAAFFEFQVRACKTKVNGVHRYVLLEGLEANNETTIESLRAAAKQIAAMGLTMNPTAKLVYFIPRRTRERGPDERASDYEKNAPWIVDPVPSYLGLCYLATHYSSCRLFGASEVYAADKFTNRGPFLLPLHEPTRDNKLRAEKQADGVYAGCRMQNGDERSEYVDAPTVQRIRAMSKVPGSLMYTTVWTEGWKKIAIRRLSKLVIVAEPRWLAAEQAMRNHEGFTFNEKGEVVEEPGKPADVPRGTPEDRPRGMSGLAAKVKEAHERAQEPEPERPEPPVGMEPPERVLLALPAPSKHPEGSIEWWLDQVREAPTLERMDAIRVAALAAKLDQGDEADTFRTAYTRRWRAIKEPKQPTEQERLV